MKFFLGQKKVGKIKIGQKMDNQVVKMLGIDQGTIFVFFCGPQIDLWTELRVEKWSKPAFFGGLYPKIG